MSARAAIDAHVAAFFALFDNRAGRVPGFDDAAALFLPDAVIVRRDGDDVQAMSLEAFLAPRLRWLADGTLVDFHEWEMAASTSIADGIATRRSRYRKQGLQHGRAIDGEGAKAIQLVLTGSGWRIASIVWQDGDGVDWLDHARTA